MNILLIILCLIAKYMNEADAKFWLIETLDGKADTNEVGVEKKNNDNQQTLLPISIPGDPRRQGGAGPGDTGCGLALCVASYYIFFGWGSLGSQLEKMYTNSSGILHGTNQSSKWETNKGWIVLVSVSEGFDSMFQNWWLWFKKLNLNLDVILVAEDQKTMNKYINSTELYVYKGAIDTNMSTYEGLRYNSDNYNKLVSRRGGYILDLLQKNLSVLYSDIDTVWLKDPRPYFKGDFDFWGQSENTQNVAHGVLCTGFLAIKPTAESKKFIDQWDFVNTENSKTKNPTIDQVVFNKLLSLENSNTLKIMNLPSKEFPTGNAYNFTKNPPKDVVLVHNNWIVGLESKIERFNTSGLWIQSS